ncbi:hypothetical protein T492DRAFT_913743 [Pavlovales sp. CCMP2436]|nr:hypothetical protein T492DRAFT_913743 [Pavlovales sp. CCMP2436]
MSLHNLAQQKAQRRDTLAATQAQKDAAKAQREQEKQDEAAELESKHVLCETMYACGVMPCEVAKTKCCPTCRTIAESDRTCGKAGEVTDTPVTMADSARPRGETRKRVRTPVPYSPPAAHLKAPKLRL